MGRSTVTLWRHAFLAGSPVAASSNAAHLRLRSARKSRVALSSAGCSACAVKHGRARATLRKRCTRPFGNPVPRPRGRSVGHSFTRSCLQLARLVEPSPGGGPGEQAALAPLTLADAASAQQGRGNRGRVAETPAASRPGAHRLRGPSSTTYGAIPPSRASPADCAPLTQVQVVELARNAVLVSRHAMTQSPHQAPAGLALVRHGGACESQRRTAQARGRRPSVFLCRRGALAALACDGSARFGAEPLHCWCRLRHPPGNGHSAERSVV